MKRYFCAALAAAVLLPGLGNILVHAQDSDAPPPPAPEDSERGSSGHEHGKHDERLKKMSLTDDQIQQITAARRAHEDAMKPLMEQMKDGFKTLRGQVKNKAADSDIQSTLDSLKATRKAIADETEKFHEALSFLTPTQRAKLLIAWETRMRDEHRGPAHRD